MDVDSQAASEVGAARDVTSPDGSGAADSVEAVAPVQPLARVFFLDGRPHLFRPGQETVRLVPVLPDPVLAPTV